MISIVCSPKSFPPIQLDFFSYTTMSGIQNSILSVNKNKTTKSPPTSYMPSHNKMLILLCMQSSINMEMVQTNQSASPSSISSANVWSGRGWSLCTTCKQQQLCTVSIRHHRSSAWGGLMLQWTLLYSSSFWCRSCTWMDLNLFCSAFHTCLAHTMYLGWLFFSGNVDQWYGHLKDGLVDSYEGHLEIPFVTWPIFNDEIEYKVPFNIHLARYFLWNIFYCIILTLLFMSGHLHNFNLSIALWS